MSDKPDTPPLTTTAILEALLFVAPGPVTVYQLGTALNLNANEIEKELDALKQELTARGLRLQRHLGRYQLTTAPEIADTVELFLGLEATSRLSKAALEALAIVAYQQPVTRPQIDTIRGVNSDGVLKNLLSKGLIQEAGRTEGPGRPILYATTSDFLQHFGLSSLDELPPLEIETDLSPLPDGEALLKD